MSEKSGREAPPSGPMALEPLHLRSRTGDGTDRQNLQDTLVAGVADERGIVPPLPQDTAITGSPYAPPPRAEAQPKGADAPASSGSVARALAVVVAVAVLAAIVWAIATV